MGTLFKSLLIFLCVYYLIRLILRAIIGNYAARLNDRTRREYEEKLRDAERRASQSGNIRVDTTRNKTKAFSKDDGEYIDYEEVK